VVRPLHSYRPMSRLLTPTGAPLVAALALALCLGVMACPSPPRPDRTADTGPQPPRNHAPVLTPVGTQTFNELTDIRIVLTAYDADGDPLTFASPALPDGATLHPGSGVFSWTPPLGASVRSPYQLEFTATDGEHVARAFGTLVIRPAPLAITEVFPGRIPQSGGTRLTLTGVGFEGRPTLRIAGVAATDVELIDRHSLRATAPALPNDFGPQVVSLSFDNGRSVQLLNGVFVYRNQQDFRLGTRRVALPPGGTLLGAADLDGIMGASLLVDVPGEGLLAVDPHERDPARLLLGEPVVAAIGVDLNGDRRDEVLITTASGEVYVWRAADEPPLQLLHDRSAAVAVTTLDLEGDGDREVLVADDEGMLWLYPWIDHGGFGRVIPSEGGVVPLRVFVADFDRDGINDLLFELGERPGAERGAPDDPDEPREPPLVGFGVAWGVETGAFLPVEVPALGAGLVGATPEWRGELLGWEVAAFDLRMELVRYFRYVPEERAWRPGRDLGYAPRDGRMQLLDVIGDGSLELVTTELGRPALRVDAVSGEQLDDTVWLMLGPVEGPPLLADLDGDNLDDLVVAAADGSAAVWAHRRRHAELPSAPLGLFAEEGLGLRVADYTRDGFVDIVVTGAALGDLPVHMLFQLDAPGLRGSVSIALPAPDDPEAVVLGDVTGNRYADILSIDTEGRVTCMPAFSSSTFGPAQGNQFSRRAVQLAPVERGVGAMHVAVRFDDGGVLVAQSDPRCNLTLVDRINTRAVWLETGELTGDSRFDLVVQTEDGALEIFHAPAGTTYVRDTRIDLGLTAPIVLAHGDLDGDGRVDLALGSPDGLEVLFGARFLGSGTPELTLLDDTPVDGVAVGDLNGDGVAEIVVTGGGLPPRVFWLAGDAVRVDTLPGWHGAARAPLLADVDRDADLDILTLEPGFGAVIWRNGAAP
jgi:hypothetical protein